MIKKVKVRKHRIHSTLPAGPVGPYVYFLMNASPPLIYSGKYSEVYDLLKSLFSDDPILESEALEAVSTLGPDAAATLRTMTFHGYLHKVPLEEALK